MRKLFFTALVSFFSSLNAQHKDIELVLTHKYNNQDFELNQSYIVDDSISIQISRLEYYLNINELYSDVDSVILEDKYLLVNATNSNYFIDNIEISNLNKMRFHIGIDSILNHADPTLWPQGHPLAPQEESMHWGWAAGYRFIALEAMTDQDGDSLFETVLQYHAVSDSFYTEIIQDIVTVENDQAITIYLDVNYDKLIENNTASQGGVFHGAHLENNQLILNFEQNEVFTNSENLFLKETAHNFQIHPNPVTDYLSINAPQKSKLTVLNLLGEKVYTTDLAQGLNTINLDFLTKGAYFLILDDIDSQVKKIIKN